jgi:hypothetical protein
MLLVHLFIMFHNKFILAECLRPFGQNQDGEIQGDKMAQEE